MASMATDTFASHEARLKATVKPLPPFTLVGFRHLGTGVLRSVEFGLTDPGDGWEPVFTGGPEVIQPVLDVALMIAADRSQGVDRRLSRFLDYRFDMQQALARYVKRGGRI